MKILLAENHPVMGDFYEKNLNDFYSFIKPFIYKTSKYDVISLLSSELKFELAVIDYTVLSIDKSFTLGLDVAIMVRRYNPQCKIIFVADTMKILPIYEVIKKSKPNCMVSNVELDAISFSNYLTMIANEGVYHSPIIKQCASSIWEKDIFIDDQNRQILYYLSRGYKVKEIESVLLIAASTIKKRIGKMRKIFNATGDASLIMQVYSHSYL